MNFTTVRFKLLQPLVTDAVWANVRKSPHTQALAQLRTIIDPTMYFKDARPKHTGFWELKWPEAEGGVIAEGACIVMASMADPAVTLCMTMSGKNGWIVDVPGRTEEAKVRPTPDLTLEDINAILNHNKDHRGVVPNGRGG